MEAASLLFAPKELAINELHPATIPIPAEIIIKYNGKRKFYYLIRKFQKIRNK